MTVNDQPAFNYQDFTFASSNGFALTDEANNFTNLAQNYYGTRIFGYDGLNRRRITRQYRWDAHTAGWALTNEVRYLYDGNVVTQLLMVLRMCIDN